jgi:hypothetical protein
LRCSPAGNPTFRGAKEIASPNDPAYPQNFPLSCLAIFFNYHKSSKMKKLLYLGLAFTVFSFISADKTLTEKERKMATDFLKQTESGVEKAIAGLSADQLAFQENDSSWSVDGCVKHIAITEQLIWSVVEKAVNSPANPEKRANIKASDEEVIRMLEDRSHKVKTQETMKPENTPFTSTDEALESFKTNREKLIEYVNSTKDDLRNHVIELPFGSFDAYQMILFIGAHSNRHTQQINEVKSQTDFPKN